MGELWRRWTRIGIAADCPQREARYYVVANASIVQVLVICIPFFFFALNSGIVPWYVANGVFIIALLGCVGFRMRGWHLIASSTGLLVIIVWLAYATILLDAGSHFWLVPVSIGSFLIFPPKHSRVAWALSGIVVVLFVALIAVPFTPLVMLEPADLARQRDVNEVGALLGALTASLYNRGVVTATEEKLGQERERVETLLLNILPKRIAERLKSGGRAIAEEHTSATVLFADIVDFTPLASSLEADSVVQLLNTIFTQFDEAAERRGLEKIKTIGDAYMLAGGVPSARSDHAEAVVDMAMEMIEIAQNMVGPDGAPLRLRIGIHSGALVAGVIGVQKFAYDLWGDTVNLASRMESHGEPGRVHVSRSTFELLGSKFELESRGQIDVKGVGKMETYFVSLAPER